MRRISPLVSVVTMLFAGTAVMLAESSTKLILTPGWDDTAQPLDYAHSFVKFSQPAPNRLNITFHLQGAEPNTTHAVGLHVFSKTTLGCVLAFGQFPALKCDWFEREGNGSYASPIDMGTITTDQNGNGNLDVNVTGIGPGSYEMAFHVRLEQIWRGDTTICSADTHPCSVIYRSPGPFAVGTVELTVP